MKRRRTLVFALTVALAFSGFAGPRHARGATLGHNHAAVAGEDQSHKHAHHSHHHSAGDASDGTTGGNHDHAGAPPASDQGCCYAWCNSVAIIHAADVLVIVPSHDEHFAAQRPFRIAAFSSAIDPPPR
jgi:hypothetical protein